ncbi:protein sneaky-like [Oppia nitens]|uniref:protein sneaky-like n=1 Tax=Oppia nitens TaxID=1686743 RepID=UPI0023DC620F|nr:protein sneaky-like [Oppia nitens]
MEKVIRYLIVSLVTIMFTVSVEMRAICCLLLPSFSGRSGRNYLIFVILITLFDVPVRNAIENTAELAQWSYCSLKTGLEQAMVGQQLISEPAKTIIQNYIDQQISDQIQQHTDKKIKNKQLDKLDNNFGRLYANHRQRIEKRLNDTKDNINDKDSHPKSKDNDSKNGTHLDEFKDKMNEMCENNLRDKFNDCYNTFKFGFWMRIVAYGAQTFTSLDEKANKFCQEKILKPMYNKTCTKHQNLTVPDKDMNEMNNMSDMISMLRNTITIDHKFETINITELLKMKGVVQQINYYRKTSVYYSKLAGRIARHLVLFVFLWIFISAKSYHYSYLKKIQFDNCYITGYFRRIDARRKKANKLSLLPLKLFERKELLDPYSPQLSPFEKKHFKCSTICLIIFFICIVIILTMDSIIYDISQLISKELGQIWVTQSGHHSMDPNVTGWRGINSGYMPTIMKHNLNIYKFRFEFNSYVTTNSYCSMKIQKINDKVIADIYRFFVLVCLLNYLDMYLLRLRRLICGYFYPIRAKKRTLFLYNETLKHRKGLLKYSVQRVRQMVADKLFDYSKGQLPSGAYFYGYLNDRNCPFLVKCLQKLISFLSTKKCIVCDEKLKTSADYVKCPETKCGLYYCLQCWTVECNKQCLVCHPSPYLD